ncbi:MAG: hypothetical protein AB1578_22875 [Thermodesulfobacteriota bacterium]
MKEANHRGGSVGYLTVRGKAGDPAVEIEIEIEIAVGVDSDFDPLTA